MRNFLGILIVGFIIFCGISLAADFTVSIPDEQIPKIKVSYKSIFNYQETIPFYNVTTEQWEYIPNPESGVDFVKRMIKEQVKGVYQNYLENTNRPIALTTMYQEACNETEDVFENVTVE